MGGGIISLGVGAELTINCSVKTAWKMGLSPLLIGLTLVSIGTSIPEMAVGIAGGLDTKAGLEASGLVVGNNIGSVLNQMTIILGICGLLGALRVPKKTLGRYGAFLIASLLLFFIIIFDQKISVTEGYFLIFSYACYLGYLLVYEKKLEAHEISALEDKIKGFKVCKMEQPTHLDLILFLAGIVAVAAGSNAVIRGGLELASYLNVAQSTVGLIFIGFGTGIPELIVSGRAIMKGDISISIGNLLGSNITDILLATGLGSVITGFTIDKQTIWITTPLTITATMVAVIFLRTGERLDRREAILLIMIYLVIATYAFTT